MKTFKLRSAFGFTSITILFFAINGYVFDIMLFYIVAFVFLMILPACSKVS